jgi:glucose uptake protein GlcU
MILFFVGIVEMAIAASWTRFVTKSNAVMNGLITYVNIFVWYYVIDQVVNHIDGWQAIIPYAAGCALGSMLGGAEPKKLRRFALKMYRRVAGRPARKVTKKTVAARIRVPAEL